ncbi:unnamed protein product [Ostreobium quekettii]|uniref:Uncharacterized protein n=1 Tax=Ostreobium quekettii TaxID=121088 RepID=A0A8S1IPW1_9CHLO|nr:unnamed protein product [Ostreobium quekettii]|eukprot:evm.model.scf_9.18 EVM.evm.TU.scf_9.18   scf_9:245941-247186(-)
MRRRHPPFISRSFRSIRSKFLIFCGKDECRFRAVRKEGENDAPPSKFRASASDKLIRNLGQVATLGVGGVMRKPLKTFELVGVDGDTLNALAEWSSRTSTNFEGIMKFLEARGYERFLTDADRSLGWTSAVVVMRKTESNMGRLEKMDACFRPPPPYQTDNAIPYSTVRREAASR